MTPVRWIALVSLVFIAFESAAAPSAPIALWPGTAPGETKDFGEEKDTTKPTDNLVAGKPVIRLGNVSQPTLTVYRPSKRKDTGTAMLVCPGGGYNILAMDLEGTEVCEWLNSIGVTAFLLKYRVPKRPDRERYAAPLQDAQRAMSLIRHRAKEFGIDAKQVGALGFSAGAHLSATLASTRERTYPAVDDADKTELLPNFTVLIYPAYLTVKEQGDKPPPEIQVTSNTPPTFITITQDDPVRMENALHYAIALKQAKVPVELHLYPRGGHGYGLRPSKETVAAWPQRVEEWMNASGFLKKQQP